MNNVLKCDEIIHINVFNTSIFLDFELKKCSHNENQDRIFFGITVVLTSLTINGAFSFG